MNILIADDEPLIRVSIQYTIQALNRPDVTVFNAANGREMLAEMQRAPVDLALVDIRMPGMSGLEAIQQAKAHWPDTDYYIMSGYSEFEYARQAVHLGGGGVPAQTAAAGADRVAYPQGGGKAAAAGV